MLRFFLFFSLMLSFKVFGVTGLEVMRGVQENSKIYPSKTFDVEMIIQDHTGAERVRFFSMKNRSAEKDQDHSRITFYRPSDVKGSAILTRQTASETSQWVYLPALHSVRQVKGNEKNSSFMGSDFTKGDIAGRRVDEDAHRLLRQDENYHYVESTPKEKDSLYSKLELKVHKKTRVISSIVFSDRKGKKLKVLQTKKVKKVGKAFIVTESHMTNYQKKSSTILKVRNIDIETPVTEGDVSILSLRKS